MDEKGHKRIKGAPTEYAIEPMYCLGEHRIRELMEEFNHSKHICDLKPLRDAQVGVKELSDLGYRFIVVTSLSDNSAAKTNREMNLLSLFGYVFDDIICLQMGAYKYDQLCKWKDSKYWWIEDHEKQAEAGKLAGLSPILLRHPYNVQFNTTEYPIVSNETPWADVVKIITG